MYLTVLINSVVLSGVYVLLALGWVIIYRATGVLNFAEGQMVLLGVFVYYTLVATESVTWWLALILALVIMGIIGALSYASLLRPISSQPLFSQIVLTMGLAIVIDAAIGIIWGPSTRSLPLPFHDSVYHIGNTPVTLIDLSTIAAAVVAVVVLGITLGRSRLGLRMRAAAEHPLLASQSGINITHVAAISWAISGALITLGGVAYAQQSLVSNNLTDLGLRGIAPALLGGLDSITGALVGAVIISLAENLGVLWLGASSEDVAAFVVILVILIIRPYGLFGSREIRRV
jgi:branched-chain amino acid transport system permease protein